MKLSSEQQADGIRDVLALVIAVLDQDAEAVAAIFNANRDDLSPLACAATGMLTTVLAASGTNVREWVAQMRAQDSRAPRQ